MGGRFWCLSLPLVIVLVHARFSYFTRIIFVDVYACGFVILYTEIDYCTRMLLHALQECCIRMYFHALQGSSSYCSIRKHFLTLLELETPFIGVRGFQTGLSLHPTLTCLGLNTQQKLDIFNSWQSCIDQHMANSTHELSHRVVLKNVLGCPLASPCQVGSLQTRAVNHTVIWGFKASYHTVTFNPT